MISFFFFKWPAHQPLPPPFAASLSILADPRTECNVSSHKMFLTENGENHHSGFWFLSFKMISVLQCCTVAQDWNWLMNDDLSGTEGVRSVELLDKTPEKWGPRMIQRERERLAPRFSCWNGIYNPPPMASAQKLDGIRGYCNRGMGYDGIKPR